VYKIAEATYQNEISSLRKVALQTTRNLYNYMYV